MKKTRRKRQTIFIGIALLFLLTGVVLFSGWRIAIAPFTQTSFTLYIPTNASLGSVSDSLQVHGIAGTRLSLFNQAARFFDYNPSDKTGAYRISDSTSLLSVFYKLYHGHQDPVRFTFNNLRTKEELAERVSHVLMMQPSALLPLLNDSLLTASLGFTPEEIPLLFIPDTYEFYWNIAPRRFLEKMRQQYDRFWNKERLAKAATVGLTPQQVGILASIVEEETQYADEMQDVAGLYLNRLRKKMPLQADPTVKFAVGDAGLRRILHEHLLLESPYNTYKYTGLPPGPIRIPSKTALDAVLNYRSHPYLYMCAKEDFSGRHNFATTLQEHTRNAARYRQELNKRNIFR